MASAKIIFLHLDKQKITPTEAYLTNGTNPIQDKTQCYQYSMIHT